MTSTAKRITKKSSVPQAEKRAQIEAALRRKRECEKRALSIVEQLIENPVDKDWLLDNAKYISQSHYNDVTEERAISLLCGYPLCLRKIERIIKSNFKISTKSNKVYDVSNRKNFCSNSCYQMSTHLLNQLLTSPLWMRKEEEIPKFTVLSNARGLWGDEIPFRMVTKAEDSEEEEEEISSIEKSMKQLKVTKPKNPEQQPAPSKAERPEIISQNPVEVVTQTFTVWFTSLSKNFLREGRLTEATQKLLDQENFQSKYQTFCSQLDVKIAQDNAIDQKLLREDKTSLKPLASYEQLKKEAEKTNLKVRAFFNGQWEYAEDIVEEEPLPESKRDAEEGEYFVTPLVDATSQKALRRRVVMQNLEKYIHPLLMKIGFSFDELRTDLKNLVATFNLTPKTATFRPNERNLLSWILINLISLKNSTLKKILEESETQRFSEELLSVYQLDSTFINSFIGKLLAD